MPRRETHWVCNGVKDMRGSVPGVRAPPFGPGVRHASVQVVKFTMVIVGGYAVNVMCDWWADSVGCGGWMVIVQGPGESRTPQVPP